MDASHFSRLPAELRNHIYELSLVRKDPLTIQLWTGKPQLVRTGDVHNILAFARVSKRFREEAASIFYGTNSFIVVTKRLGELYCGDARNHENTKWQIALRQWLESIQYHQHRHLPKLEIDIGTSWMTNWWPSSESIWRSVTDMLHVFDPAKTTVYMKTEILWKYRPKRSFIISLPLTDTNLARQALSDTLESERWRLKVRFQESDWGPRVAQYAKMEFETSGQELYGFVGLLEQVSDNGG